MEGMKPAEKVDHKPEDIDQRTVLAVAKEHHRDFMQSWQL